MSNGKKNSHDVYVKFHGPTVENDWKRVNLLAGICSQLDGVTTAKPLWVDEEHQLIGYQRLFDLAPVLPGGKSISEVMHKVGCLIARLHGARFEPTALDLCEEPYPMTSFGLPEEEVSILERSVPSGWFHTDCWHGNIFLHGDGSLVVIDPLPDGYTIKPGYTVACGAIDLAVMHMSLYLCHSLGFHLRNNMADFIPAGEALLDGYLSAVYVSDERVRRAILHLSRSFAISHVASYAKRLNWPIAAAKARIGTSVINQLDRKLDWRHA